MADLGKHKIIFWNPSLCSLKKNKKGTNLKSTDLSGRNNLEDLTNNHRHHQLCSHMDRAPAIHSLSLDREEHVYYKPKPGV